MRRTIAAIVTTGALMGSLLVASPAEAAGTCPGSAGVPAQHDDGGDPARCGGAGADVVRR